MYLDIIVVLDFISVMIFCVNLCCNWKVGFVLFCFVFSFLVLCLLIFVVCWGHYLCVDLVSHLESSAAYPESKQINGICVIGSGCLWQYNKNIFIWFSQIWRCFMLPIGRIFETNIEPRSSSNGIGMPMNLELQNQPKSNSLYMKKSIQNQDWFTQTYS